MGFIDRLKVSTNLLKLNWATLLGVGLAYASIDLSFMKMMAPLVKRGDISFTYVLLFLLMWLVRVIFLSGYVPLVIDCVKGKKVSISKFGKYINLNNFISFLCLDAIVMAVMVAGFILLLIPGIYWAAISVFSYFIVGLRPLYKDTFKAITDSIDASKGIRWHIFGYQAIYAALTLLCSVGTVLSLTLGVVLIAYYWVTIGVLFKERT